MGFILQVTSYPASSERNEFMLERKELSAWRLSSALKGGCRMPTRRAMRAGRPCSFAFLVQYGQSPEAWEGWDAAWLPEHAVPLSMRAQTERDRVGTYRPWSARRQPRVCGSAAQKLPCECISWRVLLSHIIKNSGPLGSSAGAAPWTIEARWSAAWSGSSSVRMEATAGVRAGSTEAAW